MGRPSRSTFLKREKERARFEKRQSKLARRQGAKGAGAPDAENEAPAPEEGSAEQDDPAAQEPD